MQRDAREREGDGRSERDVRLHNRRSKSCPSASEGNRISLNWESDVDGELQGEDFPSCKANKSRKIAFQKGHKGEYGIEIGSLKCSSRRKKCIKIIIRETKREGFIYLSNL